jgi:hypothetical protein
MSTITTASRRNGTSARQVAPKANAIVEAKPNLIRRRAYEIFLARNGGPGDHVSDWIQAEQELSGASHDTRVVVRSSERRESEGRSAATQQAIRDGILDNR